MILRWANYLLMILLAWLLAGLGWQLWSVLQPAAALQPVQLTKSSANQADSLFDSRSIKSAMLFGQREKAAVVKPVKKAEKVADTRLNIKLLGVLSGEFSAAIISFQGRQGSFRVEDYLDGKSQRIQLLEIYTNYVIISNRGTRERLALPKPRANSIALEAVTKPEAKRLSANLNSPQINQLLGGDARGQITNNPLSLAKFLRLSPANNRDGLKGYRINQGKDQRLLQQVGLKHGDLVTSINQRPVASLSFREAFDMLEGQNSITLEFVRQGSTYTMDLQL